MKSIAKVSLNRLLLVAMASVLIFICVEGCRATCEYDEFSAPIDDYFYWKYNDQAKIVGISTDAQKSNKPLTNFTPFSIILKEGVQLDISTDMTKDSLLQAIRFLEYKIEVPNNSGNIPGFYYPFPKNTVYIEIGYHIASFVFTNGKLSDWGISFYHGTRIGKYKGVKFYNTPITLPQLKEIFGEPKSINVYFSPD